MRKAKIKPLKITKPEVDFVVDYRELDRFISETYNIDYSCVADEEWGNDSEHVIRPYHVRSN
jgi:ribosomal protein S18